MLPAPHRPNPGRQLLLGVLAVLAMGEALTAPRAAAQADDEFQLWSALLAVGNVQRDTPRVGFWFDLHSRRGAAGTVVLVRPGVGFEVNKWLSFWAGYAWIPVFSDDRGSIDEHRLWQQAILQHSTDHWAFQARTRFEQRFSEAGDDVGFRFRQFVRANWKPSTDVPVGLAVWDEIFAGFNDTDWGVEAGFDQNRLFIGPFLEMSPWARLEAGYLFVYLKRGAVDRIFHSLAINLFVTLRPTR